LCSFNVSYKKSISVILILTFFIGYSAADGNITTTSGDLFLDPASGNIIADGAVLPSITAIKNLGSSTYTWNKIYVSGGFYSTDSSVRYYPLATAGGVQYVDYISIASNAEVMRIVPEVNYSRQVAFVVYPKGVADGLYLSAGTNMGAFKPIATNSYDLGSATNMWKTIYGNDLLGFTTIYSRTTGSAANIYIDGSGNFYRSTSSRRYKENIRPLTYPGTSWVYTLNPVLYDTKDGQMKDRNGFIAEEVAQVNPQLVEYVKDGNGKLEPDSVEYDRITVGLVKQVQYLREELCKKDSTYGFCAEPQVVQYVEQPKYT
jgi:hypothetical protein